VSHPIQVASGLAHEFRNAVAVRAISREQTDAKVAELIN
jgi:hypothetical protein